MRDFLNSIIVAFKKFNRTDQLQLIGKGSEIVTIAIVVDFLITFYQMLPWLLRLFLAPVLIGGAWFFAKEIVTPFMIKKLERYLN